MSTDGPIAYGPIGSSNLEIVQSSSGELGGLAGLTQFSLAWQPESTFGLSINAGTVIALTYGQASVPALTLGGTTAVAFTYGQASQGQLSVDATTGLVLVSSQSSTGTLVINSTTEVVADLRPEQTFVYNVSVPLTIGASTATNALIAISSTGALTITGSSAIIFNDLEVSSVELSLGGSTQISVSRERTSTGTLEIVGTSEFANIQSPSSTVALEISSTSVPVQTVDATSTGSLTLSGFTDSGELKDITVTSSGALEIAATTGLQQLVSTSSTGTLVLQGSTTTVVQRPTITQVASTGVLRLNGTSVVVVQRPTITQVASSGSLQIGGTTQLAGLLATIDGVGELEIGINNAYQFNVTPLEKVHSGHRGLKDTTQSRQVAYISQVRIARPQVRAEVGFYPAPPAQAETPRPAPRPQGPFGKFLDQYGNRLTYRYDSSTATVQFGIHSTVEVDNFGVRNQQIQQDDAWLLGFDDDDLMLDSARTQQVIQQFHDEKAEHLRRLQEDKDLLGITD